jgi:ABC-type uncharacterized transport system permease subunit
MSARPLSCGRLSSAARSTSRKTSASVAWRMTIVGAVAGVAGAMAVVMVTLLSVFDEPHSHTTWP